MQISSSEDPSVLTFDDFVKVSTELLSYENRKQLFKEDWPIYTTTHNTPPAQYGPDAVVMNSFVANGSRIKGKVINSVISPNILILKQKLFCINIGLRLLESEGSVLPSHPGFVVSILIISII